MTSIKQAQEMIKNSPAILISASNGLSIPKDITFLPMMKIFGNILMNLKPYMGSTV